MTDFLFPILPFGGNNPDELFAPQAEVVASLGADAGFLKYDDLLSDPFGRAFFTKINFLERVVYRGWMLRSSDYALMEKLLKDKGVTLAISSDMYFSAHYLPSWYEHFADVTPASAWIPLDENWESTLRDKQILSVGADLGSDAFIVKDYVKSRKEQWDTACFAKDINSLVDVSREFLRLQSEDGILNGGLVVRAYENFDNSVGQARVWWVKGSPVLVSAHPDTPELTPAPDIDFLALSVKNFGHDFITTDLALRSDGVWRVIEIGDGQVSDLPAGIDSTPLFEALRNL